MRSIPGGVVVSAFSVHSVLFRFIFFSFVVFFLDIFFKYLFLWSLNVVLVFIYAQRGILLLSNFELHCYVLSLFPRALLIHELCGVALFCVDLKF